MAREERGARGAGGEEVTRNASHPKTPRDQGVYTPTFIVERILKLWPGGIALDPFPGAGAPVTRTARAVCVDGFTEEWCNYTYVNPPFNKLKDALDRAAWYGSRLHYEQIVMAPARTHREFFWQCQKTADRTAFLRQFAFHGQKDTFPYPVCLMYWGPSPGSFEHIFSDVSAHVC